jgi:alpha-ribazole phosphatase
MGMALTLLRHAAPPLAYHGRYIGHTDIGIDPALFDTVKAARIHNMHYDRVYCSDLVRCTETLQKMNIEPFITDPRLREVRFKPSVEGKNFAEIEAMETYDPRFLESMESWHDFVCDEPLEAFRSRIENFLEELPEEENILICTHGGTIAMILSILEPGLDASPCDYLGHIFLSAPIG